MSKPKMILGLVGTFLAGCVASQVTAFVVPPARAGTAPQKWEYLCKQTDEDDAKATTMANAAGREGWEMTGTGGANNYGVITWCFKRPLP